MAFNNDYLNMTNKICLFYSDLLTSPLRLMKAVKVIIHSLQVKDFLGQWFLDSWFCSPLVGFWSHTFWTPV